MLLTQWSVSSILVLQSIHWFIYISLQSSLQEEFQLSVTWFNDLTLQEAGFTKNRKKLEILIMTEKAEHGLNLCSRNHSREFQQSGPNSFFRKSIIFKIQKQPLDGRSLGETNTKHCKITCRVELDTEHGTTENSVEMNSTFER
jgi:hypothetical protein